MITAELQKSPYFCIQKLLLLLAYSIYYCISTVSSLSVVGSKLCKPQECPQQHFPPRNAQVLLSRLMYHLTIACTFLSPLQGILCWALLLSHISNMLSMQWCRLQRKMIWNKHIPVGYGICCQGVGIMQQPDDIGVFWRPTNIGRYLSITPQTSEYLFAKNESLLVFLLNNKTHLSITLSQ